MNDEDIELALKSAGPREKPPLEVEHAVREQLRAEWRVIVAEKRRDRWRQTAFAAAAGILGVAIGLWIASPQLGGPAMPVATMTLASGEVRVSSGWLHGWRDIVPGQPLAIGQTLETGPSGRGALALPGGVSARLDHDTLLIITDGDQLTLKRGALYVDAGPPAMPVSRLDVITASGSVRHIGTQYEVRLMGSGVRLRVREGRVEWRARSGGIERSETGEQLTIASDGTVERRAMPLYGESWDWIEATAPGIQIDGLPLARFLSWIGRELGREIVYSSPQTAADVASIVVHGSISGLTPAQALKAVLATTSVRAVIADGRIVVGSEESAAQPAD
ncbi:MAG: FecR family protein [Steroidobacteraceae bacterium]